MLGETYDTATTAATSHTPDEARVRGPQAEPGAGYVVGGSMDRSRNPVTLGGTIVRVLRVRLLLFAVVTAYAVTAWSGIVDSLREPDGMADSGQAWTDELAAGYPGCLSEDAWHQRHSDPADPSKVIPPSRFVVLRSDGSPAAMRADEVRQRAASPQRRDDVWVVGWCA